jgi:hypothetical protein
MFCSECGQQNVDDAKFCIKCGKKFIIVETLSSPSIEPEKSSDSAPRDSDQARPSSSDGSATTMGTELKDSGTVTAMSVVGFVFGLIGMLGSFIPCIGSVAFYIGIPAALISAIGLGVAYSQRAKKTFAIVAVTISLIGVVISGVQYFSIISAGNEAKRQLDKWSKQSRPAPSSSQAQIPSPAPAPAQSTDQTVSHVEKEAVIKVIETLYGSYKTKDLTKYLSVIDENAIFSSTSYRLHGKDNIREKRVHTFSVIDDFDYSIKDISVEIKGNEAIFRDTVTLSYTSVKTGKRKSETVKESFKLIKKGDGWYIVENQEY